jgi:ABC-type phosphate transport system permease subunit
MGKINAEVREQLYKLFSRCGVRVVIFFDRYYYPLCKESLRCSLMFGVVISYRSRVVSDSCQPEYGILPLIMASVWVMSGRC